MARGITLAAGIASIRDWPPKFTTQNYNIRSTNQRHPTKPKESEESKGFEEWNDSGFLIPRIPLIPRIRGFDVLDPRPQVVLKQGDARYSRGLGLEHRVEQLHPHADYRQNGHRNPTAGETKIVEAQRTAES